MKYIFFLFLWVFCFSASAQSGRLSNKETDSLYATLAKITGKQFDRNSCFTIRYYAGGASCNLNDYAKEHLQEWHQVLDKKLNKVAKINSFLIYNDATRADTDLSGLSVFFDKNDVLQKFFIGRDYCRYLFLLAPNGNYFCMGDEYSQEAAVKTLRKITKSE